MPLRPDPRMQLLDRARRAKRAMGDVSASVPTLTAVPAQPELRAAPLEASPQAVTTEQARIAAAERLAQAQVSAATVTRPLDYRPPVAIPEYALAKDCLVVPSETAKASGALADATSLITRPVWGVPVWAWGAGVVGGLTLWKLTQHAAAGARANPVVAPDAGRANPVRGTGRRRHYEPARKRRARRRSKK